MIFQTHYQSFKHFQIDARAFPFNIWQDKEVDKIDARAFPFKNKNISFINQATKEHSDLLLQSLGYFNQ
jgi:hypothetical protein